MYSFEPNEEQRMLMEAIERYATNDLRVAAHDADETGELPVDLIEKGWELGVLQASIPEAYGGFGERSADRRIGRRSHGMGGPGRCLSGYASGYLCHADPSWGDGEAEDRIAASCN